jgi:predicted nuclease of predicted toxin-antitoxin system
MARFLVDAQLPPALAKALREAGHEAEHLEEIGLRQAEDRVVWDHAFRSQAIIVTKDEDFVERFRRVKDGPVILWLRVGNTSNRALHAWFMPLLSTLVERIEAGDRLIEVR